MKKCLSVACTALLISFGLQAQTTIKPAIGINFTDFSKTSYGDYQSRVGWQLGGSVAFGQKVYFEPGIFYSQKSSTYTTTSSTNKVDFDVSGFRIPVAVGVNVLGDSKSGVGLRIFGGGSGYFVTGNKGLNGIDISKANWGLFAGAGVDFSMIFVEASYEWSLTNLSSNFTTAEIGKARSLFINAGIRLPL
jgi:hypothetical protein